MRTSLVDFQQATGDSLLFGFIQKTIVILLYFLGIFI
jgi:hypothetical protein